MASCDFALFTTSIYSSIKDVTLHVSWYRDPFITEIDLNAKEAEKLAEFKVLNALKLAFYNKTDDSSFWLSLRDSYRLLSKVFVTLVQFAITCLCEAGLSNLASIETKSRSSLNVCRALTCLCPVLNCSKLPCSVHDGAEYQRSPQANTRTCFALTTLI